MCGRFDFHGDDADIATIFGLCTSKGLIWPRRYNTAPTDAAIVIVGGEQPEAMRPVIASFGWRKDFMPGGMIINARSETVQARPLFRRAFAGARCVIPANGFFEWERAGKKRLPWYLTSTTLPVFGLAGLYEPGTKTSPGSFVILTTEPNAKVAPFHNRMPVILDPAATQAFVSGKPDSAEALLRTYDANNMQAYRVDPAVNRAGYDGPSCIEPT